MGHRGSVGSGLLAPKRSHACREVADRALRRRNGRVERQGQISALAAVLAAAVLFGTTGTAQALGPDGMSPLGVGAVRVSIGALGLLAAIRISGGSIVESIVGSIVGRRNHRFPIAIAGLGVAGYQIGFFVATERAGVALGTLVALGSGPAFAGLYQAARTRRPPSVGWSVATSLAAAGAGLVAFGRQGGTADDLGVGLAAALLAGLSYAVFSIAGKRAMDSGMASLPVMAASFTVGSVLLAPLLVTQPMSWLSTGRGLAVALHLGLAATALAYALFGFGLARLTVPTVVTVTLFEPATAALLSVVALSEPLDVIGWLGVVLVMAGVALVALLPVSGEPLAEVLAE